MTVLIFGCPRSGTSILGEMFEHVPGYQFYFEPSMRSVERLDHEQWNWAIKNPIGPDPTPGLACNLDALTEIVPDPVALFIHRHPLDVICSMQQALSIGVDHGPVPPHAQTITDPIERAAHVWTYINSVGVSEIGERFNTLLIPYAEFVARPGKTVDQILVHINNCAVDLWDYINVVSSATGGYEAKHQDRWVTDNHEQRVGRWRDELSTDQTAVCWDIVSEAAEPLGYTP